ncbi:hypothetical protein Vretimale_17066 [Volvox reticuliferus]|uniref:Uncharacterized protein n=1 Tax=Volvox reticuliferus TaxID=1737510 RepID=A0A8J4CXL3_9CHLO|nr:hypothetical protein Vretifemale_18690 [Volvox reticuliferus]GIM14037.1 hypothetical protein Vretimale_17066 [Volvox reticuliferus]
MSASERNRYFSPPDGPEGEGIFAPGGTPAGTFGTALRSGPSSHPSSDASRARSPIGYVPSTKGASSTTPSRQRGYAELALARGNIVQAGTFAPRSKTPAATRYIGRPSTASIIPDRRARTPPSRVPSQYRVPAATSPGTLARPSTVGAGAGSIGSRQVKQPNSFRGQAMDAGIVTRSPGGLRQGLAPGAAISPVFPNVGRPHTTSKTTSKAPARQLAYGDSPYTAVTATYPVIAPGAAEVALPGPSGQPHPRIEVPSGIAGVSGRFQDPGDDWISNYERSSADVLRELERILGGLSRLTGLATAPMEAGAPPRQLLPAADMPKRFSRTSSARSQLQPGNSAGQQSHGVMSLCNPVESDLQGAAWSDTNQGVAGPHTQPASVPFSPHPPLEPSTMSSLLATYAKGAGRPPAVGPITTNKTTTAAAVPNAAFPTSPFPGTMPTPAPTNGAGSTADGGVVGIQGLAQPATAATQSLGADGSMAPPPIPANTVAEFWSVLQACNQNTSRLMADLAAARQEAEIAKERAEEADSLARAFQQQLILRQKSVTAWHTALVEMEEREAAAREQLHELQESCAAQAERAQQAEHVAATAQLRLERILAAQQMGQSETGKLGGSPPPQLEQQLEHLQADLAAAKTRATRAELELAVARNKALIAQQEMLTEEERARRAAAAAAAAKQELARTRAALERVGLDHNWLQNQVADLRSKIGDAVRWSRGSNRHDPFAQFDQREKTRPTAATSAPPTASPGLGTARTDGTGSLPPSPVPRPVTTVEGAAEGPSLGGTSHAVHGAVLSSGDGVRPPLRPSLLSVHSSAAGSASTGNNSTGDRSHPSSPSRRDAAVASRRRRRGSVLLVAPDEMPLETSASLRYGQRLAMRRRSRSQDPGVMESPSGGDDEPDGWMRSPRAVSGSHDGVVMRLNIGASEDSGPNRLGGGNIAVAAEGRDDSDDGTSSAAGTSLLTTGSMRREVTEEMLPLTRTPSSGVRRRLPSLRTSHGSISRDVQSSARTALLNHSKMPTNPLDASADVASVQKASAASITPAAERVQPEHGPPASKRMESWRPGRELASEASSTETVSREPTPSAAAPATPARPPAQQQHNNNRQGSLAVSLADLRRQMAASTAAAGADCSPAVQRQQTASPSLPQKGEANAVAAMSNEAAAAAAGNNNRSPASQPPSQEQRSHQSQPAPTAAARALPALSLPATTSIGGNPRTGSTLPELLPPLEHANSPTDREPNLRGNRNVFPSPSLMMTSPEAAPQPGVRASGADTALCGGATAPAGPAQLLTPSVRTQTAALPTRHGTAMAVDTRPPHGYSTSHINGLYESMQSRGSWGFILDPSAAASPRRLSAPPLPEMVPVKPLRDLHHGQLTARPYQNQADNSTASWSSGNRPSVGPGVRTDGSPATGSGSVFTARTRMLTPDHLDSFVVSPSAASSMATTAAVVSVEGSQSAASTAKTWRQPMPPHLHAQAVMPRAATGPEQGAQPVMERSRGPGPVEWSPDVVLRPHPMNDGTRGLLEPSSAVRNGSGASAGLEQRTSVPLVADGALATGASPRRSRRPWWQWLIPRRPRIRSLLPNSRRQTQPTTLESSPRDRGASRSSPSLMKSVGGSDPRSLSPQAASPAGSDRTKGHTGTSTVGCERAAAGAGMSRATEAKDRSPPGKAPRRRGGGGLSRFFMSTLLHIGMWSGGMAVGVALVLGLAGVVEGTLGVGAATGPPAAANREICSCPGPGPEDSKSISKERGKYDKSLTRIEFRLS